MAETTEAAGKGLYFLVGGLFVVVALLVFVFAGGRINLPIKGSGSSTTVERTTTVGPFETTTTTTTEKKN